MGKPPMPRPAALPPPAAHPSILGSSFARLRAQKSKAAASVFTADDTIATSPQGLTKPKSTAKATLLGQ